MTAVEPARYVEWMGMTMTYLVVVWLLASGQFQGERFWQTSSMEVCKEAREKVKTQPKKGRVLFYVACLEESQMESYTNMEFTLESAPTTPSTPK